MSTSGGDLGSSVSLGAAPATTAAAATTPAAASKDLDLSMQAQLQGEWCWAAVSASVSLYYLASSPYTQCELANEQLGQTTCCKDGSTSACDQPWYLDRALAYVGHLEKDFGGDKPPMALVAEQIEAGKPVGVSINWTGGGGHFVVVDGYDSSQGLLDVKDPLFGPTTVNYSSFPETYQGGGVWAWTYLTR